MADDIYVNISVRYEENGESKVDDFAFHDYSPEFPMTDYLLQVYEGLKILNIQTIHSNPPNPLPIQTHPCQSRRLH